MTGDELKKWRTRVGLTQAEAADRLGVASNTIARWERGEMTMPSFVDELVSKKRRDTPAVYLRTVMQEQELSIRDVVRRSGGRLSHSVIAEIMKRDAPNPTLQTILALAKGLGRSPTEVFQAFCGERPYLSRDVLLENIQRNYSMVPEKDRAELRFLIEILNREVNSRLRKD